MLEEYDGFCEELTSLSSLHSWNSRRSVQKHGVKREGGMCTSWKEEDGLIEKRSGRI